jgi:nucleoside-diphosphate-sugar epimerase
MLTLAEALRRENREARVVFTGSRLEYGRVGPDPVAETHDVDPLCVHAIHKLMAEQYLRLYERLYGISYAVARVTNPYGPGQPRSRIDYGVVNRLIHLALAGETLPIYGDGGQRRDYIYIDDVVEALLALGSAEGPSLAASGIYNVGTGIGTSIADMATAITRTAGGGRLRFVPWPQLAEQIETGDFVADITRIRAELRWQPAVALEEGLRRTVAFYRTHVPS